MDQVGIRELKQNASAVVADAVAGEVVTITDRGRPVALLGPIGATTLETLLRSGLARPPRRSLADLPAPIRRGAGKDALSSDVIEGRDDERY